MNKFILAILLTACSCVACKQEAEATCPRCVEARANNLRNASNSYFYYEDYQSAQKSQTQPAQQR